VIACSTALLDCSGLIIEPLPSDGSPETHKMVENGKNKAFK
jgi:hypothetical protein